MKKLEWSTIQRCVNDLVPQTVNPRKVSPEFLKKLADYITKIGFVEIPVIDFNNEILAGHQRISALKLLGRGEEMIDVRFPNRKLSKKEAKEYVVASNALVGEWNFDLLKTFETEMLLNVGFDKIELSKAWDTHKVKKEEFDVQKELKKIKKPKTRLGDVILLGKHRLICGDSTDENVVKKLVNDKQADLVICDLPYNQKLDYGTGVGGKKSKKNYGGNVKDDLSDEDYTEFVRKIMRNALSVSKKDLHAFFWCTDYYIWVFQTLYKELGLSNKRVLTWIKNNSSPTPQIAFNRVTESCCYALRGKPYLTDTVNNLHEVVNPDVGTGNEVLENINNLLLVKRLPSSKYEHPTEKPPELHHNILKRCSKINDIVLDLTAGSGSLLISCEQLGRIAYVAEINPVFCDLIIRRYEALTNKKAIYEKA